MQRNLLTVLETETKSENIYKYTKKTPATKFWDKDRRARN